MNHTTRHEAIKSLAESISYTYRLLGHLDLATDDYRNWILAENRFSWIAHDVKIYDMVMGNKEKI